MFNYKAIFKLSPDNWVLKIPVMKAFETPGKFHQTPLSIYPFLQMIWVEKNQSDFINLKGHFI